MNGSTLAYAAPVRAPGASRPCRQQGADQTEVAVGLGAGSVGDRATAHSALVALMEGHETTLYGYLVALLRDREAAQDCTQETFLRAYDALLKGRAMTTAWLYTVARNLAVDEFRRRKRVSADDAALQNAPASDGEPDMELDVQAVMARLPMKDREVLHLFEIAGYSSSEIAELLGVRSSAVRQRLSRARGRFRALCWAEA